MAAVAAATILAAQVLQAAPAPLAVQPDSASPGRVAVELRGAPALALREYLARDSSAVRRDQVFSLAVNKSGARVPMMARLEWSGDTARLLPQAPLTRGITYVAVFEGPKVKAGLPRLTRDYRLPADSRPSSAKLAAVYPNDPVLPANLLKFYLCFSAPMAQGELFKHVRLLDASGKPILQALREVELWSEDHRRATVWISPGRTKSSLGLSEALGPVLKPNARFTLEVTPGLRDTQGRVLKSGFKRAFKTAGYDHQQPRIQGWQVTAPSRGSSEPLVVKFGEPLDHFLAARLIAIQDEQGHPVTGAGQVAEDGRSWTFRPRALWSAGKYAVVAGGELEDLAGNSLLRPFEATTGTAPKPSAAPPVYRREFRVGD